MSILFFFYNFMNNKYIRNQVFLFINYYYYKIVRYEAET